MKISSKGRYAVRVLAELATADKEFVSLTELAEKQNISLKYLERIVALLTKANLLASAMGAQGGYKLTKSPREYRIADILLVTGDLPQLAPCLTGDSTCTRKAECRTTNCWDKLSQIIYDYLASVTIQDLVDKHTHL